MTTRRFYQNCYYHIFNKSIAGYNIFKFEENILRFISLLKHYNNIYQTLCFSKLKTRPLTNLLEIDTNSGVKIIAYCIMPTHYHLLVKIMAKNFLSHYIGNIENSFSRYLNLKQERKGPLWQSRFQNVYVKTDQQLLHLTRYIHLNPSTSGLVEDPAYWAHSSYQQYIADSKIFKLYLSDLTISNSKEYRKFVLNRKDFQRKLKMLKKVIIE